MAGAGRERRLHFGTVVGTRSPSDDLDLDGPLHAFRVTGTDAGRNVLALVGDGILDTARLRRLTNGAVSVERY